MSCDGTQFILRDPSHILARHFGMLTLLPRTRHRSLLVRRLTVAATDHRACVIVLRCGGIRTDPISNIYNLVSGLLELEPRDCIVQAF